MYYHKSGFLPESSSSIAKFRFKGNPVTTINTYGIVLLNWVFNCHHFFRQLRLNNTEASLSSNCICNNNGPPLISGLIKNNILLVIRKIVFLYHTCMIQFGSEDCILPKHLLQANFTQGINVKVRKSVIYPNTVDIDTLTFDKLTFLSCVKFSWRSLLAFTVRNETTQISNRPRPKNSSFGKPITNVIESELI